MKSSAANYRRQFQITLQLGSSIIESVKKGMSRTAASEQHGVPLSTLKDRFNGREQWSQILRTGSELVFLIRLKLCACHISLSMFGNTG